MPLTPEHDIEVGCIKNSYTGWDEIRFFSGNFVFTVNNKDIISVSTDIALEFVFLTLNKYLFKGQQMFTLQQSFMPDVCEIHVFEIQITLLHHCLNV